MFTSVSETPESSCKQKQQKDVSVTETCSWVSNYCHFWDGQIGNKSRNEQNNKHASLAQVEVIVMDNSESCISQSGLTKIDSGTTLHRRAIDPPPSPLGSRKRFRLRLATSGKRMGYIRLVSAIFTRFLFFSFKSVQRWRCRGETNQSCGVWGQESIFVGTALQVFSGWLPTSQ